MPEIYFYLKSLPCQQRIIWSLCHASNVFLSEVSAMPAMYFYLKSMPCQQCISIWSLCHASNVFLSEVYAMPAMYFYLKSLPCQQCISIWSFIPALYFYLNYLPYRRYISIWSIYHASIVFLSESLQCQYSDTASSFIWSPPSISLSKGNLNSTKVTARPVMNFCINSMLASA